MAYRKAAESFTGVCPAEWDSISLAADTVRQWISGLPEEKDSLYHWLNRIKKAQWQGVRKMPEM